MPLVIHVVDYDVNPSRSRIDLRHEFVLVPLRSWEINKGRGLRLPICAVHEALGDMIEVGKHFEVVIV